MKKIILKITIKDIDPPIWRRIAVSSKSSLLELHDIIQFSFGWTDSHYFIFTIESMEFVYTPDWEEDAYQYLAAEKAFLEDLIPELVPEKGKFTYTYDMGDNWVHEILVEKVQEDHERVKTPLCLSGSRACPPENVGGTMGYQDLLQALIKPQTTHQHELIEWIGVDYDPDEFDSESINRGIGKYLKTRKLKRESSWNIGDGFFKPVSDFQSKWTRQISSDHEAVVDALPFRRDMVAMLNYLQNHHVKGTKARGNFPLKHIRGLSAIFSEPLELDTKIGDRVYKLRTEDEVPDLVFIHSFANVAGLIVGGEDLQWLVSIAGKIFLDYGTKEQLWYLLKFWFTQINWYYWYPFSDLKSTIDLDVYQILILDLLLHYPLDVPIAFNDMIDDLDEKEPGWVVFVHDHFPSLAKKSFLFKTVISPLSKFGLIETIMIESPIKTFAFVSHIKVNDFGHTLMKSLLTEINR